MSRTADLLVRAESFAATLGIQLPILLAPMAGACPASLSIAVANAGGMGACGANLMTPASIRAWVEEFRGQSGGSFQINLWIPGPPPLRNLDAERRQREFLALWGPTVSPEAAEAVLPDFEAQCRALIDCHPRAISSIVGLYAPAFVAEMKESGILWFATATTVAEARAAADAGADAIIAQGMEAGGHRGTFNSDDPVSQMVGLFALLPQICDAVSVPVIAAGGIADARGIAAALMLGASAVQIGTGYLRSPEAKTHPAYAERIAHTDAHETRITRAFTGRAARSIRNSFTDAAAEPNAPPPAPYPIQRAFARPMREDALRAGDVDRLQMWAGQSARFAQALPAAEITQQLWHGARGLLG